MSNDLLEMLQDLSDLQTKSAASADPPTSHPVGSAPDGTQDASTGSFAAENEAYAKENQGPAGVDSAKKDPPAQKKEPNDPAQEELNPGTAEDPPDSEIKPTKTVADNTATTEAGLDELENKAAATQSELADYLKEAAAILPQEEKPAAEGGTVPDTEQKPKVETTETTETPVTDPPAETPAETPAAEGTADPNKEASAEGDASEDEPEMIDKEAADKLLELEQANAATFDNILTARGIAKDAPSTEKLAALVEHYTQLGERGAEGFLISLDTEKLANFLQAKSAQDVMEAPTTPEGGPPAAPAAPAAAPAADPMAGGGGDIEAQLTELLQMVQSGQITIEQLLEQLRAAGVPEEIIQMIAQQAAAAQGGGEPAAAPAPNPEDSAVADAATSEAEKPASEASADDVKAAVASLLKVMPKADEA